MGKEKNRFFLSTDKGVFQGDALILAAGSKAAPVTGSDGSGYKLAERLGHRILTPLPALVQLRCGDSWQASARRQGLNCTWMEPVWPGIPGSFS